MSDSKTRSLLRGLANRGAKETFRQTLNNLRAATDASDREVVARLLIYSPLFSHLPLPVDFPDEPPVAITSRRLETQHLEAELLYQCLRIQRHANKLKAAMRDLWAINAEMLAGRGSQSMALIKSFTDSYGYSNLILHKLAYLRAVFKVDETIVDYCNSELERYGLFRRVPIALAAADLMDDIYPLLSLRRNLLEFVETKKTTTIYKSPISYDIVNFQFRPIRSQREDVSAQLASHGLFSVLDVAYFIFIHLLNVGTLETLGVAEVVRKYVDEDVLDIWTELSTSCCPGAEASAVSDELNFDDELFYRRSLAFVEYRTVSVFRNIIDPYHVDNKSKPVVRSVESVTAAAAYFHNATSLSALVSEPAELKLRLDKYVNANASAFLRTVGFIHLLRSGARSSQVSAQQMLSLMNNTAKIADIAKIGELRDFFDVQQGDALANYLAQAVISDCSRQNIDQHKLRRALQDIVMTRFGGDLVAFADTLWASSKYVAYHLYELCTEAFLVQLFFLFPQPEMVFEARAQLLDWYAVRFNDPASKERAKTLRLDQKLRKVRGEIDDARIYVDPLRFNQWLHDNQLEKVSGFFQADKVELNQIDEFRGFSDFAYNRLPYVQVAAALQNAFSEFCTDKRFGIDSYLGRRIRHGTLKGVMLVELQSLRENVQYRKLFNDPNFARHVNAWFERYEAAIEMWGKELFQVASKAKPRGAIGTDITDSDKIVGTRIAMRDIVKIYSETKSVFQLYQIVLEHCWRLIEQDLILLRAHISSQRLSWGVIARQDVLRLATDDQKGVAAAFCRELNKLTDEKFRALSRWFSRPTNLAPSAPIQLLLDATLDEVKGHFPDYHPNIERSGLSDIELIGMYYHHVYDFMYVVIYNAAKHGNRNGRLLQRIELSKVDKHQRLEVAISSEIRATDTIDEVRANIESAMSGDIEDAMVIEGRSGIKKLLRMSTDIREIRSIGVQFSDRLVEFRCVLDLDFVR